MEASDRPSTLRRAAHIAEWLVEGEVVLYDARRERVHVCNETAAAIWRLCDGAHDAADVVETLVAHFPESRPTIGAHVAEILGQFRAERLLIPGPSPHAPVHGPPPSRPPRAALPRAVTARSSSTCCATRPR
jgi:hypothetical protein